MKKNKNKKIIFKSIILAALFFSPVFFYVNYAKAVDSTLSQNKGIAGTLDTNNVSAGTLNTNNTSLEIKQNTAKGTAIKPNNSSLEIKPNSSETTKKNVSTTASTATNATGASGTVTFSNPLKFSTVDLLLGNILTAVQRIIGTLALVFVVIGAGMILSSAGNPDMVERGKKAITMAFIGLAIGVAAPSLLKELSTMIGWNSGAAIKALTVSQIAVNVLNFLLGIAGVLTLIMLVIGGTMYLTSAGDEDRIDQGKTIFKNSLIGILIILAAMVLVQQIAKFFVAG